MIFSVHKVIKLHIRGFFVRVPNLSIFLKNSNFWTPYFFSENLTNVLKNFHPPSLIFLFFITITLFNAFLPFTTKFEIFWHPLNPAKCGKSVENGEKRLSKYRTKNKRFICLPLHIDVLEIIDLLATNQICWNIFSIVWQISFLVSFLVSYSVLVLFQLLSSFISYFKYYLW